MWRWIITTSSCDWPKLIFSRVREYLLFLLICYYYSCQFFFPLVMGFKFNCWYKIRYHNMLCDWQLTCSILYCFVGCCVSRYSIMSRYHIMSKMIPQPPLAEAFVMEYWVSAAKGFLEYIFWIAWRALLKLNKVEWCI